ncbi:MAG: hypothetical protein HY905_06535 [Deltaproteobacteria bacterium]|nr:hypothetical protein [Deltaproteobacteria bacterium]
MSAVTANDPEKAEQESELQRLDDAWVEMCRRNGWVDKSFSPQRPSPNDDVGNGWLFLIIGSACFAPCLAPAAMSDAERWTATMTGILFLVWGLALFLTSPRRPRRFDEQERSYREKRRAIVERPGSSSGS